MRARGGDVGACDDYDAFMRRTQTRMGLEAGMMRWAHRADGLRPVRLRSLEIMAQRKASLHAGQVGEEGARSHAGRGAELAASPRREGTELDDDGQVVTEAEREVATQKPRMFRVLIHNDDYTTRDFVVDVLVSIFHKSESAAVEVMLHVHRNGSGVAGVYTREVSEMKVQQTMDLARAHEFPLQLTMEPEEDA